MSPADLEDLQRLYAGSVDPWNFRESAYEQAKFAATRDALARPRYAACLELGCGNGELARHVAPLCDRYVGVDAVEIAHVEDESRRLSTGRPDLPHDGIDTGFVEVRDRNPGALVREEMRGRPPHATRRAGHEHDPIGDGATQLAQARHRASISDRRLVGPAGLEPATS